MTLAELVVWGEAVKYRTAEVMNVCQLLVLCAENIGRVRLEHTKSSGRRPDGNLFCRLGPGSEPDGVERPA